MSSSIDDSTTDKEATDDASLRSIQKENTNEEDDLASALELKLKVTVKESEVETADKEDRNDDDNEVPEALQRVAEWMQNGSVTNVLVLTGAGVSVAAGIPDFRTPGTGLYDNLQKYNLPYAEAVFDIDYYQRNPLPFVQLASELWPNELDDAFPKPTLTHSFIALLSDKGLLLRNYSQVTYPNLMCCAYNLIDLGLLACSIV